MPREPRLTVQCAMVIWNHQLQSSPGGHRLSVRELPKSLRETDLEAKFLKLLYEPISDN